MNRRAETDLTRRFLLMASGALVLTQFVLGEDAEKPILFWRLEETGDDVLEAIGGTRDKIESRTSHARWVGTGRNRALRLDGYSVWVSHNSSSIALSGRTLTVAAWLALESYPVDDAAVVHLKSDAGVEYSLSIDRCGYLSFSHRHADAGVSCKSQEPVPKSKLVHLAATLGDSGIAIYADGLLLCRNAGNSATTNPARNLEVTLGKAPQCPVVAGVFPTGVLNGLLRDARVFDAELSAGQIAAVAREAKPDLPPDLEINAAWCSGDPHRPVYHAIPPRAWTNEPHGLIHFGGQYHLFYQKNPNGPYWGHIHWGHMTSPDVCQWTEMPVALAPEPGPDQEGCWSGSVIDHDGKLAILYTGSDGHGAAICLAQSEDGINFIKHPANPVIPHVPEGLGFPEFRDPFVWREGDVYYLIIGSAVKNVGGTALLYRSKDLISWEFRKPLLVGDRETSGVFWEMPIFVKAGDLHVLIVCEVPGRSSYWVGTWRDETFTPHSLEPRRLELFNHMLSPTPLIDAQGRVITIGIVPDERRSKACWTAGWAHLYSLPRVLTTDASGRLLQKPLEAISRWEEPILTPDSVELKEGSIHGLDNVSGKCLHLQLTFRRGESQSVAAVLARAPDGSEQTEIRYEWEIGRLTLDRSRSSLDAEVKRDVLQETYFPAHEGSLELNIYLDHSILEVFVDSRSAFATRIYPTLADSDGIALRCSGFGARAERIWASRVRPITRLS